MLKITIGSGKEDSIEFAGSGLDLCTSILYAILHIYKTLAAHDPKGAAEFRLFVSRGISSPEFWSINAGQHDHICIIQPTGGKGGRS